jgi:hypothetical protein
MPSALAVVRWTRPITGGACCCARREGQSVADAAAKPDEAAASQEDFPVLLVNGPVETITHPPDRHRRRIKALKY